MADLGSFTGALISKNNKYTINNPIFSDDKVECVIDNRKSLYPAFIDTENKCLYFNNLEEFNRVSKFTSIFIHDEKDNLIQINSNMVKGNGANFLFNNNVNKITLLSHDFNWNSILQADIDNIETTIEVLPQILDINGYIVLGNTSFSLDSSFIKIGNEIMRIVDSSNISTGILIVERAQKQTTATSHLTNANVVKEFSNAVAVSSINMNTSQFIDEAYFPVSLDANLFPRV